MTVLELREKRARVWEGAKAFLEAHRNAQGVLSAEDDLAYTRMEQEITALGKEIDRMVRAEALDRELAKPVTVPITNMPLRDEFDKPEEHTGRETNEYRRSFWAMMRKKSPDPTIFNVLQVGTPSEGGYLVPDEFEKTLVEALEEENIFRQLTKAIRTSSGSHKIPVSSSKGSAAWLDEGEEYPESDDSFGQVTLDAYKLGTLLKISEELLNDSAFDLPSYVAREFARRMGNKEEEAFFVGDGSKKPLGILAESGGAQLGVTAASSVTITADELIDLFYSLSAPYRKRAVWTLNDSTVKIIRKLKDGSGQYLWQPGLLPGTPDTLLGRPMYTSAFMPTAIAGNRAVAFGDFSYYWIADREVRTFKRLNELFATKGQVGFLASQRVDGRLVLPEAVKVLQMKA